MCANRFGKADMGPVYAGPNQFTEFGYVYGGPPTTIDEETDKMWHFVLLLEDGTSIRLMQSEISVGRSPDSYVVVSNSTVSRSHALLQFLHGKWFLKDCGSLNGTALNGQRLSSQAMYELHDGDRITLSGEIVLLFRKDKGQSVDDGNYPRTHAVGIIL